jgi:hypothetical protein
VLISYRRYGTTFRSHLRGSRILGNLTSEDHFTTTRSVITQKNTVLKEDNDRVYVRYINTQVRQIYQYTSTSDISIHKYVRYINTQVRQIYQYTSTSDISIHKYFRYINTQVRQIYQYTSTSDISIHKYFRCINTQVLQIYQYTSTLLNSKSEYR